MGRRKAQLLFSSLIYCRRIGKEEDKVDNQLCNLQRKSEEAEAKRIEGEYDDKLPRCLRECRVCFFFVRFGRIYSVKEGAGPEKQKQSLIPPPPLLVTDTILGVVGSSSAKNR